jgi:hypothetical protein
VHHELTLHFIYSYKLHSFAQFPLTFSVSAIDIRYFCKTGVLWNVSHTGLHYTHIPAIPHHSTLQQQLTTIAIPDRTIGSAHVKRLTKWKYTGI